jgi:hypothetical protein
MAFTAGRTGEHRQHHDGLLHQGPGARADHAGASASQTPWKKAAQKTFPGGKSDIRRNVKGDYSSAFAGYTHNDTVGYVNPANNKQINFPWKELHAGISVTHTELKIDGISVVDTNGEDTVEHSDREVSRSPTCSKTSSTT